MKVLIVLKTKVGGLWILPHVRELRARGHEVTVMLPDGPGRLRSALEDANIPVLATRFDFSLSPSSRLLKGLVEVRRALRRLRPDVVMYHLIASALVARVTTIGMRARTVHMVPGPLYLEVRVIALVERLLARMDDYIIAGSDYTRRRYARLGYPVHRLSSIPYGVDTGRFTPGRDQREALLGVDEDTFVVVMVAYVYAPKPGLFDGVGIKGHDILLQAWSSFRGRHPGSHLVLLGGGFDEAGEAHRQRLLARANLDDLGVTWRDTVEDVRPYYDSADLSVSPSLSENHGAALEASSMGVPSIVSDAGALPEAVTTESGWIVPAGDSDALLAALESAYDEHMRGHLRKRGVKAREFACERFDATRLARDVADIVEGPPTLPVLVVTEQRCHKSGSGRLMGWAPLTAVLGITEPDPVIVIARETTADCGGVEVLPGSWGVLLPWTGAIGALRASAVIIDHIRRSRLVVVYAPGTVGSMAGLIAVFLRRPLAVVAVGDPAESLQPPITRKIRGWPLRCAVTASMRFLCRQADLVRYVTCHTLQRRYPTRSVGVAASDVAPLGPGERKQRPGFGILTVASLEQPYKGVAELIDAVSRVREYNSGVRLVVVGDGRLRQTYASSAERLGEDAVRFTGQLDTEGLAIEYASADLFVLASWTEGMPRALLEAMEAGLPCLATRVGGVVELLPDWALVPPRDAAALADAIRYLVDHPEVRDELSTQARQRSARVRASAKDGHREFLTHLQTLARDPRFRQDVPRDPTRAHGVR